MSGKSSTVFRKFESKFRAIGIAVDLFVHDALTYAADSTPMGATVCREIVDGALSAQIQRRRQLARFDGVGYIYRRGAGTCRIPPLAEKELVMSQDTDSVLSQISEQIDAKELEQTRAANQRVGTAYGSESRGLIVVVHVTAPAKPEDQF